LRDRQDRLADDYRSRGKLTLGAITTDAIQQYNSDATHPHWWHQHHTAA
jgi:hypothetical protein